MIRAILVFVVAVLAPAHSFAQDTNESRLRALDNFSREATDCAAFYLVSSGAHHNSYDSVSAERTKKMSDALLLPRGPGECAGHGACELNRQRRRTAGG